jgi:hypothetical protein
LKEPIPPPSSKSSKLSYDIKDDEEAYPNVEGPQNAFAKSSDTLSRASATESIDI